METHEDVNEQQNEKTGIPVHINKRYEQNNINRRHGDILNNPNERKTGRKYDKLDNNNKESFRAEHDVPARASGYARMCA